VSIFACFWVKCDTTLEEPKRCFFTVRHKNDIAHIAVNLNINDRFSKCVFLYWLYKLSCSRRLEEMHKRNGCSYKIGTEMLLEWHGLLNNAVWSTAIDAVQHQKLLETRCSVTSNTFTIEKLNINQYQVSVYTQLHVTYFRPNSRSLPTHNFM
jgi:hypothetical protein